MPSQKPRILLVGAGGYGNIYLEELLRGCHEGRIEIAGAVDPAPGGCRYQKELAQLGVTIDGTLDSFFEKKSADLAVVTSPLQFHREHTIRALQAGASVLCEKPMAPTVQDAFQMKAARDEARRDRPSAFVAIGYQWSFSEPILALKHHILEGRFGRPLRFKSLVCWPRTETYYTRNGWAGRISVPVAGYVLDGPANNAMAHYLHNMFFVLGAALDRSAAPAEARAELYRANAIENYDTIAMRCATHSGVELFLYASHAVQVFQGPLLEFEFERAVIRLNSNKGHRLTAEYRDGGRHDYGQILEYPDRGYFAKLWRAIDATQGGEPVPCSIEAAMSQTICMNGVQRPADAIPTFDRGKISLVETPEGRLRVVEGLQPALVDAYRDWTLPGDSGRYDWTTPAKPVDLRNYVHFDLDAFAGAGMAK